MFVTNWISTTKIQKISEITNFFRHYFLSRTEVYIYNIRAELSAYGQVYEKVIFCIYGDSFRLVLNGVFHRLFI